MATSSPSSRWLALVVLCGLAASGCAGGEVLGTVRGTVSFQGAPVRDGMVLFTNPEKGVNITAPLQENGTFEVQMAKGFGLPVGTYQVAVIPPLPKVVTSWPAQAPKPPPYPNIPARYRDPKTSDLKVEVVAGGVEFNVDMTP
jgi:hypothetical protein